MSGTENQVSGPGWLYVESKITRTDILDEDTYVKWYETQHLPDLAGMSGIFCARWFKDLDPSADRPYLALYTLDDLGFVYSQEFKDMALVSDLLPGGGNIFSMADFFMRQDNLVQVYDPATRGPGHTETILSVQTELKEDIDPDVFDKCYRDDYLHLLSQHPAYVRTTRSKLAGVNGNAPSSTAPKWIAVHEFAADDVDLEALTTLVTSPATEVITHGSSMDITRKYRLINVYGDQTSVP